MDGFIARWGWIRAIRFEDGEKIIKDYEEDTESRRNSIGLDFIDSSFGDRTPNTKETRFRRSFSPKHSLGLAGKRQCHHHLRKEELTRPSTYKRFQSGSRITNSHHHALPSTQKNNDQTSTLPYLATPPGSDGRRKKLY